MGTLRDNLRILRDLPKEWRRRSLENHRGQAASDAIASRLESGAPLFVGRFGSTEIESLVRMDGILAGRLPWAPEPFRFLSLGAGVYPLDRKVLEFFHGLYREAMPNLDILGSWCPVELHYAPKLKGVVRVPLADLEPYYHRDPWSRVLAGRRVLVVHPFARTIQEQYGTRRERLFPGTQVLPAFDLHTVPALQCHDGNAEFPTWIDAWEEMKRRVETVDFDVAILGCGAFGFPLAAHVKAMGKQAIHLGGATQVMFGIRGKRWESMHEVARLFNEDWTRAQADEIPGNAVKIENGAYW